MALVMKPPVGALLQVLDVAELQVLEAPSGGGVDQFQRLGGTGS